MPDTKFGYWFDWRIDGPDESSLIDLRESRPSIDKEKLSDIDYLCERINDYPEVTLMEESFWYEILKLREKAFKDKTYSENLKEVCKAIAGDGRGKNSREEIEELRIKIINDISFFKEFLDSNSEGQINVKNFIEDFLLKDVDEEDYYEVDRQFKKTSNCEKTLSAYRHVFDRLRQNLSQKEIFCFFEKAASCLGDTDAIIDVNPDGRRLTFMKTTHWYIKGDHLHLELFDS